MIGFWRAMRFTAGLPHSLPLRPRPPLRSPPPPSPFSTFLLRPALSFCSGKSGLRNSEQTFQLLVRRL